MRGPHDHPKHRPFWPAGRLGRADDRVRGDGVVTRATFVAETFAKLGDQRKTAAKLGMTLNAVRKALYRARNYVAPPPRVLSNACVFCGTPIRASVKFCAEHRTHKAWTDAERQAIEDARNAGMTNSQLAEMFGRSLGSVVGALHRARQEGRVGHGIPGRRPKNA